MMLFTLETSWTARMLVRGQEWSLLKLPDKFQCVKITRRDCNVCLYSMLLCCSGFLIKAFLGALLIDDSFKKSFTPLAKSLASM